MGHQSHSSSCTQHHHHKIGQQHPGRSRCMSSTPRLCGHASQCRVALPRLQHDSCHSHGCFLPIRDGWQELCLRTLLSHESQQQRFQQRGCPHTLFHHEACHVLSLRGRTGCSLLWLKICSTSPHHTRRDGSRPTKAHPCHHQQHHSPRPNHGHHDSQSLQIHGPTFPLAQMPGCSATIPVPLAQRHPQQSQLRQQTPCTQTSSTGAPLLCLRQRHLTGPMRSFHINNKQSCPLARVC